MTFQKKLGISQASSFGISLVGPTLGPYLRLGYLYKVLPSGHVFESTFIIDNLYITTRVCFT